MNTSERLLKELTDAAENLTGRWIKSVECNNIVADLQRLSRGGKELQDSENQNAALMDENETLKKILGRMTRSDQQRNLEEEHIKGSLEYMYKKSNDDEIKIAGLERELEKLQAVEDINSELRDEVNVLRKQIKDGSWKEYPCKLCGGKGHIKDVFWERNQKTHDCPRCSPEIGDYFRQATKTAQLYETTESQLNSVKERFRNFKRDIEVSLTTAKR